MPEESSKTSSGPAATPLAAADVTAQVLLVDDEPDHAEVMAEALKRMGHVCTLVHDVEAAGDELKHGQFDLIVTDLVMVAEDDGMKVLESARATQPNAEVVMVTAHGDVATAKQAIKGGAFDFIEKPLDLDLFRTLCTNALNTVFLRAANTDLKQQLDATLGFEGILGNSPAMRQVIAQMKQVAPSPLPILITGESGTGKELVARAIHNHSRRASRQFVPINCAGLSESILEDELFGHVRGAFTGAEKDRQGRFEYASGGTMFLDEIGDMPKAMQAKLLRVLESGEVVRLGSNDAKHVDIRLISATNVDLDEQVKNGGFREDLYFRIKGVQIELPPLRNRREDIPVLVRHFVAKFAQEMDRPTPGVAEDAMNAFQNADWPGNVRQLLNAVQNTVVMTDGDTVEPRHLPPELRKGTNAESAASSSGGGGGDLPLNLDQLEKQAIRNALRVAGGNREQAAKMLGIGERTLYRKLNEYGLK
ncbi:MAG: sigma-54 dependent transcriptional regulator [Planctomycetota bacterium]